MRHILLRYSGKDTWHHVHYSYNTNSYSVTASDWRLGIALARMDHSRSGGQDSIESSEKLRDRPHSDRLQAMAFARIRSSSHQSATLRVRALQRSWDAGGHPDTTLKEHAHPRRGHASRSAGPYRSAGFPLGFTRCCIPQSSWSDATAHPGPYTLGRRSGDRYTAVFGPAAVRPGAKVAEPVDALALDASGATRESSSLSFRTIPPGLQHP